MRRRLNTQYVLSQAAVVSSLLCLTLLAGCSNIF